MRGDRQGKQIGKDKQAEHSRQNNAVSALGKERRLNRRGKSRQSNIEGDNERRQEKQIDKEKDKQTVHTNTRCSFTLKEREKAKQRGKTR